VCSYVFITGAKVNSVCGRPAVVDTNWCKEHRHCVHGEIECRCQNCKSAYPLTTCPWVFRSGQSKGTICGRTVRLGKTWCKVHRGRLNKGDNSVEQDRETEKSGACTTDSVSTT
jgi:hypothetical protein